MSPPGEPGATALALRPLAAAATRPLRQRILRPGQAAHELVYPGDDEADSLHVGAFVGEDLLGVASLYRQSPEGQPARPTDWRLRGMAVVPEARRHGVGAALLAACEGHARAHGGDRVWFNARADALPFYVALGYAVIGEEYELPGIGPHRFAERRIAGDGG
ncbi:MAG: GNAT family N-acetyltransferase [Candidatus Eisenbacteria bacterium]